MILVGNQRGGAKDLARHLLKTENEHVDVHELRGFVSDTLPGALNEAYAISRATKCKQFLFSLSLNPPPNANVPTGDFENAVNQAEERLGLAGQPRAIVFHEKHGRRHCHAVWSRIDGESLKAVQLSFTKRKLMGLARDLFMEHGWRMPKGLVQSKHRDPRNFSLAEWQQAKRAGKDAREVKTALQDCWAISDSPQAFQSAMEERGYKLARGDRRSFVAVDMHGEVYAIARWVGVKTKAVRERLGDEAGYPSIAQCRALFASQVASRLNHLKSAFDRLGSIKQARLDNECRELVNAQQRARAELKAFHQQRREAETARRQARFSKGLHGIWDRLTGAHQRIKTQNELEQLQGINRDRVEMDALIFSHLEARRALEERLQAMKASHNEQATQLADDVVVAQNRQQEAERNAFDEVDRRQSQSRRQGLDLER